MPAPRLYFSAGYHLLNGAQAEIVVRSRVTGADYGRIQNQKQVIKGLANQMLTPSGIAKIPALYNQLRAYVLTDFTAGDITQMACLAAHLDPGEDLIIEHIISSELQDDAQQIVWDTYQEQQTLALVVDPEIIIQRLADFEAGIWPQQ